MKRINSHVCSIAYPILEQAGVLAHTRLKSVAAAADAAEDDERGPRWSKGKPTAA